MTHWRRSPRPVSLALEVVRDELAPETLLADVQRAWPEVVGGAIAIEAQPTAERGGVVTVSCSAAVWAQELDLMAPAILARLNGALGGPRVSRLRCVAVPFSEGAR
jgi:predicted nucleic acid-binding Zn ribbon protein